MLQDLLKYLPMFISFFWATTLLLPKAKGKHAKHTLGVFMLTTFLLYLSQVGFFYYKQGSFVYFDAIYTFCTLSVYPFLYFYIQSLTLGKTLKNVSYQILTPAIILSLLTALFYSLMDSGEQSTYVHTYLLGREKITLATILIKAQTYTYIAARVSFIGLFLFTLIKGQHLIRKFNKEVSNTYSNTDKKKLNWTYNLLIAFAITSSFTVILNIIGRVMELNISSPIVPLLLQTSFSTLLFSIGYLGFQQEYDKQNLEINTAYISPPLYTEKPNLNYAYNRDLLKNINRLFINEKIFRQKELKINDIAAKLHTNRTYISNLVNSEYNCSFSDYVNQHRVKEAKQTICEHPEKSFDEIAGMVGYGSLSTFFRSFKLSEGITPSAFRKKHCNSETTAH